MKIVLLIAALWLQGNHNPAPPSRTGVVTGRLSSAGGIPSAGARIVAMAAGEEGRSDATSIFFSIGETGASGRYRLENIPPGRYYIRAGTIDFPTYFPGAVAEAGATAITVTAGSVIENIDFTLLQPLTVSIAGRLAVTPTLQPAAPIQAMLSAPGREVLERLIGSDGAFEFPKVAPGVYRLWTTAGLPALPLAADRDLGGIQLGSGAPGVKVTGGVVFPATPAVSAPPQTIYLIDARIDEDPSVVLLGPDLASANGTFAAVTNAEGRFEFLRIPPGTYVVQPATAGEVAIVRGPGASNNPSILVVEEEEVTGLEVALQCVP